MTKKDYIAVAAVVEHIRRVPTSDTVMSIANATLDCVASALADLFASDNPRFDRNKFMEACK